MDYEAMLTRAYAEVKVNSHEVSRFEIPKVTGHHEGTKTIITNFSSLAGVLRRPLEHLMKFLNKELATASEISGERLIFSRKLSSAMVNEKVEKYAHDFVLCGNCGKPDTEILDEAGKLTLKCLACGTKRGVHKL